MSCFGVDNLDLCRKVWVFEIVGEKIVVVIVELEIVGVTVVGIGIKIVGVILMLSM